MEFGLKLNLEALEAELKIDTIDLPPGSNQYQSLFHQSFENQNVKSGQIEEISASLIGENPNSLLERSFQQAANTSKHESNKNPLDETKKEDQQSKISSESSSSENDTKEKSDSSDSSDDTTDENGDDDNVEKKRKSNKKKERIDGDIQIQFNFEKMNCKPVQTSFILYKDQNEILNYQSELLPNVMFDINRTYTDDPDTYVSVDVYKKTIKQSKGRLKELEKPIGHLQLKLEPNMRDKEHTIFDNRKNEIILGAFRDVNQPENIE